MTTKKELDEQEMVHKRIKKQLEEDFPKDSGYYDSMMELYRGHDGPAMVLYELRQRFGYSRYSEIDLKNVCDEFFS